jgi:hypothetical protein
MNATAATKSGTTEGERKYGAFMELMQNVYAALKTYSNVPRGSGYNSVVNSYLSERAREIVLEYLGRDKEKYTVGFLQPAKG